MADKFDDIEDFDLDSFGEDPFSESPKNDRHPVSSVLKGTKEEFLGQFTDSDRVVDTFRDVSKRALGNMGGAAGEVTALADDVYGLARDAGKVAKKEGRRLMSIADSYIPDDGISGKIKSAVKDFLGEDEENNGRSSGPSINEKALAGVIGTLGEAMSDSPMEALRKKKEELVNLSSNKLLAGIQSELAYQRETVGVTTNKFYRKSLELQFRTALGIQEQLEFNKTFSIDMRDQLDAITKNTALPDIQKINKGEFIKSLTMKSIGQSMTDRLINNSPFATKLKKKFHGILENMSSGLSGLSDGAEMAASMGGQISPLDMVSMQLAGLGKDYIGGKAGSLLHGTKAGNKIANAANDFISDPADFFFEKGKDLSGSDGFFKRKLGSLYSGIGSLLDVGNTDYQMTSVTAVDKDSAAIFNMETRKSITRVIPDLLSKILYGVRELDPKITNDKEIYFNYEADSFLSRGNSKRSVEKQISSNIKDTNLGKKVFDLVKRMEKKTHMKLSSSDRAEFISSMVDHVYNGGGISPKNLEKKGFFSKITNHKTRTNLISFVNKYTNDDNVEDISYFMQATKDMGKSLYNPTGNISNIIRSGGAEELIKAGIVRYKNGSYSLNNAKHKEMLKSGINTDISRNSNVYKESTMDSNRSAAIRKDELVAIVDGIVSKAVPKPVKKVLKKLAKGEYTLKDIKSLHASLKAQATKMTSKFKRLLDPRINSREELEANKATVMKSIHKVWSDLADEAGIKLESFGFDVKELQATVEAGNNYVGPYLQTLTDKFVNEVKSGYKFVNKNGSVDEVLKRVKEEYTKGFVYLDDNVPGMVDTFKTKTGTIIDNAKSVVKLEGEIGKHFKSIREIQIAFLSDAKDGKLTPDDIEGYKKRISTHANAVLNIVKDGSKSNILKRATATTIKALLSNLLNDTQTSIETYVTDINGNEHLVSLKDIVSEKIGKKIKQTAKQETSAGNSLLKVLTADAEVKDEQTTLLKTLVSRIEQLDGKKNKHRRGSWLDRLSGKADEQDQVEAARKLGMEKELKQKKSSGLFSGFLGKLGLTGAIMSLLSVGANAGEVGLDGKPVKGIGSKLMERFKETRSYHMLFDKGGMIDQVKDKFWSGAKDLLVNNWETVAAGVGIYMLPSMLRGTSKLILGGLGLATKGIWKTITGGMTLNKIVSNNITIPLTNLLMSPLKLLKDAASAILGTSGSIMKRLATIGGTAAVAAGGKVAAEAGKKIMKTGAIQTATEKIAGTAIGKATTASVNKAAKTAAGKSAKKVLSKAMDSIAKHGTSTLKAILAKPIGKSAKIKLINALRKKLVIKLTAKATAKAGSKIIPGVGLAISGFFAYDAFKDGKIGRGMAELASGALGFIPGIGTGAATAIQMAIITTDVANALEEFDEAALAVHIEPEEVKRATVIKAGNDAKEHLLSQSIKVPVNNVAYENVSNVSHANGTTGSTSGRTYVYEQRRSSGKITKSISHTKASAGKVSVVTKILLDQIAEGEGTSGDEGYNMTFGFHAYDPYKVKISELTVGNVLKFQVDMYNGPKFQRAKSTKKHISTAVGKYQYIHKTLKEFVTKRHVLKETDTFSPFNQDKLAEAHLIKICKFDKWLSGTLDDKAFIYNLSKVWASIEDPFKVTSHYGTQPAPNTYAKMKATLERIRNTINPNSTVNVDNTESAKPSGEVGTPESSKDFAAAHAENVNTVKMLDNLYRNGIISKRSYVNSKMALSIKGRKDSSQVSVEKTMLSKSTIQPQFTYGNNVRLGTDVSKAKRTPKAGRFGMVGVKVKSISEIPRSTRNINAIVVHCTATDPTRSSVGAKAVDVMHKQRKFDGIGYHFVIRRDGTIEYGRNINYAGAHVEGHNRTTIGISYEGGVKIVKGVILDDKDNVPAKQLRAIINLSHYLAKLHGLNATKIVGHNEFPGVKKACPNLTMDNIRIGQYSSEGESKETEKTQDVEAGNKNYDSEANNESMLEKSKAVMKSSIKAATAASVMASPMAASAPTNISPSKAAPIVVKHPDVHVPEPTVILQSDKRLNSLLEKLNNTLELVAAATAKTGTISNTSSHTTTKEKKPVNVDNGNKISVTRDTKYSN